MYVKYCNLLNLQALNATEEKVITSKMMISCLIFTKITGLEKFDILYMGSSFM